jgi:L-aspartate oxidase
MEFIQFHPTTLFHPEAESFLISEALRGHGAVLKNAQGEPFLDAVHPMGSLAPRDDVARAIDREMKRTGAPCVYLDIRHAPADTTRRDFPTIHERCLRHGIDITRDLIPVVPAAHYMCGGVRVDLDGRSSVAGLYSCGETACTGVHGANRLASNSLLEALVFARRAAEHAAAALPKVRVAPARAIPAWDDSGTSDTEEWILLAHDMEEVRSVMWDYVGIVRSTVRLCRAWRRICLVEGEVDDYYRRTKITPDLLELRNVVTTAKLVVASALRRRESRGLHYTTDFPESDDRHWRRDTVLRRAAQT